MHCRILSRCEVFVMYRIIGKVSICREGNSVVPDDVDDG